MTATQGELLAEITVHCFFRCGHVVRALDPQTAHDTMEGHYRDEHRAALDRIIGE